MFQNTIAHAEINGLIFHGPAAFLDKTELIEKWVRLSPRVYINANNFLRSPFEYPKLFPYGNWIVTIGSPPTTNIKDNRRRINKRIDPDVKSHCSVNLGKTSEFALGVINVLIVHSLTFDPADLPN